MKNDNIVKYLWFEKENGMVMECCIVITDCEEWKERVKCTFKNIYIFKEKSSFVTIIIYKHYKIIELWFKAI